MTAYTINIICLTITNILMIHIYFKKPQFNTCIILYMNICYKIPLHPLNNTCIYKSITENQLVFVSNIHYTMCITRKEEEFLSKLILKTFLRLLTCSSEYQKLDYESVTHGKKLSQTSWCTVMSRGKFYITV